MKAAIISMGSTSSKWTSKAMKKYFDDVDELDIRDIEVNISSKHNVLCNGKPIGEYDCIFAKGSFRYGMALRAMTEVVKVASPSTYFPYQPESYTIGHDKILTHLRLLQSNIPTPLTYVASSTAAAKKILAKMNYPVIMKLPSGTQGKGVMYADSYASASSMLDTLDALRQPFLIQEYIETGTSDLRVIVVGNKVVAAMKRIGKKEEKRANIHAGGVGEKIVPSDQVKKICVKAACAIGAEICAIDVLDSKIKGPLIIELNVSPGLQGITKATGIDVADKIASFLFERTKELANQTKKIDSRRVMDDIEMSSRDNACIFTNLAARGSKLVLPEIAQKISKISEDDEVELALQEGKINIKKV